MVSTTNLTKIGLVLAVSTLAGCSGFNSTPKSAPVYDSVSAKTGRNTTAPAVLGQQPQTTVVTTTSTVSTTATAIENKAAQQPTGGAVVSSIDPYSTPLPSTTSVNETASQVSNQTNAQVNEQINNAQTQIDGTVAGIENDPRFKSGEEVLNSTNTENHNVPVPETGIEIDKTKTTVTTTNTTTTDGQTQTAINASQDNTTTTIMADGNPAAPTDPVVENIPTEPSTVAKVDEPKRPENAAQSLIMDARDAVAAGNYEKAASSLERAHSIEPKNAKILYDIAQIRYAQGKYVQSESFASKAASLSSDNTLSKKIWTLLANSRKALGNQTGAQLAQQKANSF